MKRSLNALCGLLGALLVLGSCADEQHEPSLPEGANTYGYVKDTDGNPVPNVSVSDGYTVVRTDQTGMYVLKLNPVAAHIYYTTPAEYKVAVDAQTGLPGFFVKTGYYGERNRYDFTLEKLPEPETRFDLYCIGDPQTKDEATVTRFIEETTVDIKAYAARSEVPCYAMALGDVVDNKWDLYPLMADAMRDTRCGMPVFQTIGNHDHKWTEGGNIYPARQYRNYFGPANYSFDRGQVHFISMDNCLNDPSPSNDYYAGITDEQLEWALQDLSFVPKTKMVILCIHIPYYESYKEQDGGNLKKLAELLTEYAQFTIMSSHKHTNNNFFPVINGKEIYEHNAGATCGAHWHSTLNLDGAPIGYGIYRIDGTRIIDWIYKPVNYDEDFQLRLYRAEDTWGKYQFARKSSGRIIVNVWNTDPQWTVKAVEDGEETDITNTLHSSIDAWAAGYHVNIDGCKEDPYGNTRKWHYYYYDLKNPATQNFKVVATDRFGRSYEQTRIITSDDILLAGEYPTAANN